MGRRLLMTEVSPRGSRGSRGYILAKDECSWYDGPDWVPFNIWQSAEYGGNSSIERECARRLIDSPGAKELWEAIAKRYERADGVSGNLAVVCGDALESWRFMPRDTPSDFKEGREQLARRAEQLALELERFFMPRDADEHEWPGLLDVMQLMTKQQLDQFDQAIRITTFQVANSARVSAGLPRMDWEEYNDIGDAARAMGYQSDQPYREDYIPSPARNDAFGVYGLLQPDHTRPDLPYGGVPTLPDMLRRIAGKFREDGDIPPLTRPNLANAERNFFTRFLCKYFWKSFRDVSPAIVRDVVSMFYPQGIGENDVSQVVAQVKRDYPLPPDPENSCPK